MSRTEMSSKRRSAASSISASTILPRVSRGGDLASCFGLVAMARSSMLVSLSVSARPPGAKEGSKERRLRDAAEGAARGSARAHLVTRANDSRGLTALLRNFFRVQRAPPLVSRWTPGRPENRRKRNARFAMRNERFRDGGRKSLKSLGREMSDFAESCVFKALNPVSFRAARDCAPASRNMGSRPIAKTSPARPQTRLERDARARVRSRVSASIMIRSSSPEIQKLSSD